MAINTADLVDYSWSDIAKAAKTAMMSAALGGASLKVNGREIGRITVKEATDLYNTAIEMVNAELSSDDGAGVALVRYGRRV